MGRSHFPLCARIGTFLLRGTLIHARDAASGPRHRSGLRARTQSQLHAGALHASRSVLSPHRMMCTHFTATHLR
ncbi:hypothetical protein B0H13DRAFT_2677125 [Mycena leptocephala]|nr:hypothetical protein B0H13DRAFT_2677125 [Mycena leptocephala]